MTPAVKPCLFLLGANICALLCTSTHARSLAQVSRLVASLLRVPDVPEQCEHYLPAQTLRSEEVLTGQPTCATRVAGILLSQLSPIYQFVLFRAQVLQATGTPMTSILPRSPPGKWWRTVSLQQSLDFSHCISPLRIVQALPCQNWH